MTSREALLDSGAQVSALSESWCKSNFDILVRPISDIVGSEVIDLKLLTLLMKVKFHV